MKRAVVAALLLVPALSFATTETLVPNEDHTDSASAAAYAASPACNSGTACTSASCYLNVDDTVASGDAAHVSGTTCDGSSASDYTQTFGFATPTVGTDYTGTQTLAMRYFEPVSDGTDPAWSVAIGCDAGTITTCASWTAFNGTTEVADTTSCTFTAAQAAAVPCSPADTRAAVTCTASGGSPGNRRSCALDAIELRGDFVTTTTTLASNRRVMIISETHDLTDVLWDLVKGWFAPKKAEASGLIGGGMAGASANGVSTDPGVAAQDWTSAMIGFWGFEEADGATALDTGAGSEDDFSDVGTVVRDTTNFVEGAKSAIVSDTDYFSCADATCTGIDVADGDSITFGCFFRLDSLPTLTSTWVFRKNTASTGYSISFNGASTNDPMVCKIDRTVDVADTHNTFGAFSTGTWYSAICIFDDPDGVTTTGTVTATMWVNATNDGGPGTGTDNIVPSDAVAYLNSVNGSNGITGNLDACFYDNTTWTAAEVSRGSSGGVAGTLLRCSSGDNTLYKGCDSNSDCGGLGGICDTGASAIDDTYCTADTVGTECGGSTCAGCCMGYNSTLGSGQPMTACNASAP